MKNFVLLAPCKWNEKKEGKELGPQDLCYRDCPCPNSPSGKGC